LGSATDIGEGLGKTLKELRKIRGERKEEKEKKEGGEEDLISGLKKQVEEMPGVKEAKAFREAADKVKKITKILNRPFIPEILLTFDSERGSQGPPALFNGRSPLLPGNRDHLQK
jgi:hypothetical protein